VAPARDLRDQPFAKIHALFVGPVVEFALIPVGVFAHDFHPFVDNSISKTINVLEDCPFSEFRRIYDLAYEMGLKGCTTFRPNPVTGIVSSGAEECGEAPHYCVVEREAD
jgi:hypothetical protein